MCMYTDCQVLVNDVIPNHNCLKNMFIFTKIVIPILNSIIYKPEVDNQSFALFTILYRKSSVYLIYNKLY